MRFPLHQRTGSPFPGLEPFGGPGMNHRECPHGIVAGTCNWCMAEQLEREGRAIEEIRVANSEREREEAKLRYETQKRKA